MRGLVWFAIVLSLSCAAPPPPPSLTPPHYNRWVGVTPETPEQAALRIWDRVHGKVNPQCVDHVHNAKISTLPEKELQKACNREKVAACMVHYDPEDGAQILLNDDAEGQSYDVLVHEFLHVLLWCHGLGKAEANRHEDAVWRYVPLCNLPPESPWYLPPPKPKDSSK